jgi:hypothetical protein
MQDTLRNGAHGAAGHGPAPAVRLRTVIRKT